MKKDKLKLTHRDACFDLAEAKGTRFIEVPLGSIWFSVHGQADVITIKPSYTRFNLDIYEVKVTRSDFLSDIRKEKYKKYLPHCNRLYYAVLDGVAEKNEMPEDIGLIKRTQKGWSTIKSAKKRDVEFDKNMLLALAFSNGRVYQQRRINLVRNNPHGVLTTIKSDLKGFGKRIKNMILNYNNLELKFNNLLFYASLEIPFNSEKEKEDFINYWENKSYIRNR
jgi:hypothetical protein